jgi:hypothetical protein
MGKDERSRILGVAGPWVMGLCLGSATVRLPLHLRRARDMIWSRSTFVKTIQEFFGKHLG